MYCRAAFARNPGGQQCLIVPGNWAALSNLLASSELLRVPVQLPLGSDPAFSKHPEFAVNHQLRHEVEPDCQNRIQRQQLRALEPV